MRLTRIAVDRPVTTAMFYSGVLLLGFVSLRELSVDLLPEIGVPRLAVVTVCPDAAPEELETAVTEPLESAVSRIPGIRRIESITREGISRLDLEFDWGTDMDFAALRVREQLDAARSGFPEEAENPRIEFLGPRSKPVMTLALTGDRDLLDLKEFAEELVKPRLEQIEGIGSAEITGGVEREITIVADARKLDLYGLTVGDIARRVDASNRNLPGGRIRRGGQADSLRIVGAFESVEEIAEIGLPARAGGPSLRLGDIASVGEGRKERPGMTRWNGRECIGLRVRKEAGANTVRVTRAAREVLSGIGREYPGIEIRIVVDQARAIGTAVGAVKSEIIQGAALAFLILFLFLQEWKTPLIIDTVVPISVIGTFSLMYVSGLTLNLMSLGGLALGVGMLDDCAVVVSESICRQRRPDRNLRDAAWMGTREVGGALAAAVLTTIAVFLPLIYLHGAAGRLFKDAALTVTFSLGSSLLVSLTLIGMLQSRTFSPVFQSGERDGFLRRAPGLQAVFRGFNRIYERFGRWNERLLLWSLEHKVGTLTMTAVFFGMTLALGLTLPREVMPPLSTKAFELELKTPADRTFEQTTAVAQAVESRIRELPSVTSVMSQVGLVSGLEADDPRLSSNSARFFVEVEEPGCLEAVLSAVSRIMAPHSGIEYSILKDQSLVGDILRSGPAEIVLRVKGGDLERLALVADRLAGRLRTLPGLSDAVALQSWGKTELRGSLRKDARERFAGLSPSDLGRFLADAANGRIATRYLDMEDRLDVRVRASGAPRREIRELLEARYPHGQRLIPLRELVSFETVRGPTAIRRENREREALVTARLNHRGLARVLPGIEREIDGLGLAEGERVVIGGEGDEIRRSFRGLAAALVLAVLLTYMIMAAQFESLLHPLLIMILIPAGAAGALLALRVTGQTVNVISAIGLIVLVGLVVDNAIVLMDYIRRLRSEGVDLRTAVTEANRVKLRPVLMSTLSTLFGLIPMALGWEAGAGLMRPLAIAVIGGLIFSTFLTLIVIPVLAEAVDSAGRRGRRGRPA